MGSMLPYIAAPWILYSFGMIWTSQSRVNWEWLRDLEERTSPVPTWQVYAFLPPGHNLGALPVSWADMSRYCCVKAFREVEEEGRAGLNSAGSPWIISNLRPQYETIRNAKGCVAQSEIEWIHRPMSTRLEAAGHYWDTPPKLVTMQYWDILGWCCVERPVDLVEIEWLNYDWIMLWPHLMKPLAANCLMPDV